MHVSQTWYHMSHDHAWIAYSGVSKVLFVSFAIREILDLAKVHSRFNKSYTYWTDVTTAKLRRHSIDNQYIDKSEKLVK